MKITAVIPFLAILLFLTACGDRGLIISRSSNSMTVTVEKLEQIITQKGMKIFAKIDHAAGAQKAGKTLSPTQVIIFGNPKVGSQLMQCSQTAGIDLPQKFLVWQKESGEVMIAYNDPHWLAKRHNLKGCENVLNKVSKVLDAFAAHGAR